MKKYKYKVCNLDCANCAREVEEHLNKDDKLSNVVVNFSKLTISFETDLEDNVKEYITSKSQEVEPDIKILEELENIEEENVFEDIMRLIIGLIFTLLGILLEESIVSIICYILAYIALLSEITPKAIKMFMNSKTIDEHLLITISCIGAFLIGERIEGLMVVILYQIGEILEDLAVNKSRKSISDLMNIQPTHANLKTNKGIKEVNPSEVKINDIILVKKGEKIPLDGIIMKGTSKINTSALTGESTPRSITEGEEVLSGSINLDDVLEIKVNKEYKNSTVSRILDLVENATDRKAKTENFVSKAAKIYTPIVILLSILVAVSFPFIFQMEWKDSIYRALCFLVISCPCAIAISVPLSFFAGIGASSKRGILIKGSDYLSNLSNIKTIIFDKTGTITKGEPSFELQILNKKYKEKEIKEYYVMGESLSTHPIALSILDFFFTKVDLNEVKKFKEISGRGLSYEYKNKNILIGSSKLVDSEIDDNSIYLKIDKDIVAKLTVKDSMKDGVVETIEYLKKHNIHTMMLTGDNKQEAERIAKLSNIENYSAELLPEDKYNLLEQEINKQLTAFVGDGINDAPSLARSDIGISMGNVGSSSAIEASDVVIINDDITKIKEAMKISHYTNFIIKENLIFAIGVKVLVLTLSALGIASMWQAVFADTGVTLLTILNSMRILKKDK